MQILLTDCGLAKRLIVRLSNGHGYIGLVHRDTKLDGPEVKKIVRRLSRRKPIN